jgi:capsular polysaccharide biosynthesis protein
MARKNYSTMLWHGWQTIIMFALLGLVMALIISFVQPLKYSSTVRLLVLQDVGTSVDAYTASRSEERIAENLSTVIYTTTFFNQVMEAGFSIDETQFPEEDYKKRREWGKTVAATVARGTGMLNVSSYHTDVVQAEQIVQAVAFVLTQNVSEYTSGGNIDVRLIDAPLNSRWPVKPNIFANIFSGLVLGGLVGVGYVLLQAERIRRRHRLVHEKLK